MKRLCAMALSAIFFASAALADAGTDVLTAHAACDGSFFRALRADAARWSKVQGFSRKSDFAFFRVPDRTPTSPKDNAKAEARFAKPIDVGGLDLLSYFDADLSEWSYFRSNRLNFISWGFNVGQPAEHIAAWLSERAPAVGQRLMQREAGTPPGVFCAVDMFENGVWKPINEACDTGLPLDPSPRRVFAVRPSAMYDHGSVMSCEIWGALTPELIKPLRPDL